MKIPKELVKGSKWYINFASSTYTIEILQIWGGNVMWKRIEEGRLHEMKHIESLDDFFADYRCAMPHEDSLVKEEEVANDNTEEVVKPKSWWQMFCERFNADNNYDT